MTELEKEAAKLQMSSTLSNLASMAQNVPFDTSKIPAMPDEIKSALATSTRQMIDALDNGRIHFDNREDRALFYGLLMVNMELLFEGKFARSAVKVTTKNTH
jgi:hypothetical protein